MIDINLLFEPVAGTLLTVTANSTNVLDMLTARDVGAGDQLELNVNVLVALTSAGATTLQITYQTSADNAAWVDIMLSPVYPKANLVAGALIFQYKVPKFQLMDVGTPNRYHRLVYTVATGPFTGGSIQAWMSGGGDRQVFNAYPRGYSIGA